MTVILVWKNYFQRAMSRLALIRMIPSPMASWPWRIVHSAIQAVAIPAKTAARKKARFLVLLPCAGGIVICQSCK
jgi:hypothetical protein